MVYRHGGKRIVSTPQQQKAYKGLAMEGPIARWYARNTGKMIDQYQKAAHGVAAELPSGSHVLGVAPGPGYFAIELARLGSFHVVGLDISHAFVRIATENAQKARAEVEFRQGNASSTPVESNCSFMTRWIFKHVLLKRAYLPEDFRRMATQTAFKWCEVKSESIEMEVSFRK